MSDQWSVQVEGETFNFSLQSPGLIVQEGNLGVNFRSILDKLQASSVPSYRHRERFLDFEDLKLGLIEDVTETINIYGRESDYQQVVGELCTLTISILDARVRWKRVTVESVVVTERNGPLIGRGANVDSKHTIASTWNFRRQQEGEIQG